MIIHYEMELRLLNLLQRLYLFNHVQLMGRFSPWKKMDKNPVT